MTDDYLLSIFYCFIKFAFLTVPTLLGYFQFFTKYIHPSHYYYYYFHNYNYLIDLHAEYKL